MSQKYEKLTTLREMFQLGAVTETLFTMDGFERAIDAVQKTLDDSDLPGAWSGPGHFSLNTLLQIVHSMVKLQGSPAHSAGLRR